MAVVIMLVLAIMQPALAPWLILGAIAVAFTTWVINRQPSPVADTLPMTSELPVENAGDGGLMADVFEASFDPMMIIAGGEADDIAGRRILLANAAARELFPISGNGGLLVSIIREPGVLEAVDEALFLNEACRVDYISGGAQERHWRAQVHPLPARDGHGRREPLVLMTLKDETDLRRIERMRVDFLANASHELRTPLASLTGFIETLRGHAKDDPKARDRFLDIMATQADRMSRLVADLLSLSRIELNEHIAPDGRVDLARATSDVIDAVSIISREREVRVVADLGIGGADVIGERDEIVQVVQNLVDNALKYSSAGSSIEVTIERDRSLDETMVSRMSDSTRLSLVTPDREQGARYVVVTVRDHGPGMAREYLPRLTERFYRIEGQKSGERQGTGLGLAIVRHIVIRHRGALSVESVLGSGALFAAAFPIAPQRLRTAAETLEEIL
nr:MULTISPECIES: ATP-binding protein [unclassified Brevundimonas]